MGKIARKILFFVLKEALWNFSRLCCNTDQKPLDTQEDPANNLHCNYIVLVQ